MDASRRILLAGGLALAMARVAGAAAPAGKPVVTVYKSSTCGCCAKWVVHLQDNGFPVKAEDIEDLGAIKRRHGVPARLEGCHTAIVEGYVVEGHVPADLIDRLLRERPRIAGLAVPGMPVGSPGMESAGQAPDRYDVLAFEQGGRHTVYARR